jgi:thioredoxin reductase
MFDVIIIGGSYAGLAAGLQLARARCKVLIIDAGQRRNRFAATAHGFLGHDGQPPGAIAAKGRAEVLKYDTVSWRDGTVTEARAIAGGFAVRTTDQEFHARRLILATGVIDELPELPGLKERFGQTVFLCPYCHGYELGKGRLGVLATQPLSIHQAVLVAEWAAPGEMTFFVDGAFEPDADQLADLAARRIAIERERVVSAASEGAAPDDTAAPDGKGAVIDLHLRDGRMIRLDGLFIASRTRPPGPFAEQLGCALEAGHTGPYYKTDMTKETTVPGVFACGDTASMMPVIALAVADGTIAGASAHRSLVFRRD